MRKRINILGTHMNSMTMDQCVLRCLEWCSDEHPTRTLITLNVGILMMMRGDRALHDACSSGDLIVPDGVPMVWASHLLGTPLAGRVAGVELMQRLFEAGHREKLRIFLLGAKQDVIDTLQAICANQYPDMVISGTRNGYFNESEYPEVIRLIRDTQSDILFIGMPTPFKETWGEKHRDEFNASVIIGVGGSFDVVAGFVKRAPVWMQKAGMEWFWRLMMEPRKLWKRYLITNSQFLYYLGLEVVQRRLLRKESELTDECKK